MKDQIRGTMLLPAEAACNSISACSVVKFCNKELHTISQVRCIPKDMDLLQCKTIISLPLTKLSNSKPIFRRKLRIKDPSLKH